MDVKDGGALSRSTNIETMLGPSRYQVFYPEPSKQQHQYHQRQQEKQSEFETFNSNDEINQQDDEWSENNLADLTQNVSLPPDSYPGIGRFPCGKLLIFNIENLYQASNTSRTYFNPRKGTNKDRDALTQLFLQLGFVVHVFNDVTRKELEFIMINMVSRGSFQGMNCLFVAFLTHGLEKHLYMIDGKVAIRTVTDYMKGPNLSGKPKVLIIQACQGESYMGTLEVDGPVAELKRKTISFPSEADFLYAYSTAYGYYSWRNGEKGSWFIQGLCKVFRKHAHTMDVVRMLTRVNAIVAQQVSRTGDPETSGKRQVTSTVSQLRKELYLMPLSL